MVPRGARKTLATANEDVKPSRGATKRSPGCLLYQACCVGAIKDTSNIAVFWYRKSTKKTSQQYGTEEYQEVSSLVPRRTLTNVNQAKYAPSLTFISGYWRGNY